MAVRTNSLPSPVQQSTGLLLHIGLAVLFLVQVILLANASGVDALTRPHGIDQIESTFGQECNSQANDAYYVAYAVDTGKSYTVRYHWKLRGIVGNVRYYQRIGGHLSNVLDGWWGYNCRLKRNGTDWSTHAYGIAIDGNTAGEHPWLGHNHYHVWTVAHRGVWTGQQFYDGINFNDPGHFQWATGY